MEIYEKLIKPISEVNYLRAENVDRYRIIMRYFYQEYERIHYWLHREDIYDMMHRIPSYQNYTIDMCQQDLSTLVQWGNLTASQDSNKARTIEDFKNKKYRYQLSEYSVEIERMTLKLENLEIEGASLEPTLLERIYHALLQLEETSHKSSQEVYSFYNHLMDDFKRLNTNYQDYIKTLNSAKAEELMKTTEFLLYKDKIIMYLREFVINMQEKGMLINSIIESLSDETLELLFTKSTDYELSIPRLNFSVTREEIYDNYKNKWLSLYGWFVGRNGYNEVDHLYDISNEIIRKMTRYAQQISELMNRGSNRKEQYQYIANLFSKCDDINQAHCMAAYIFGVASTLHLTQIQERTSDDINVGVYQEDAAHLIFDTHSRIVKKKSIRKAATDYKLEREIQRQQIEAELSRQESILNTLIIDNTLDFSKLPTIDANIRKTLLSWLTKGLIEKGRREKSHDGRIYHVDRSFEDEECMIHCDDGDFLMPHFILRFEEGQHE